MFTSAAVGEPDGEGVGVNPEAGTAAGSAALGARADLTYYLSAETRLEWYMFSSLEER